MRSVIVIAGIIFFLVSMSRCSHHMSRTGTDDLLQSTKNQINATREALDNGSLPNAIILRNYSKQLAAAKPQLSELAETLGKDATTEGALYKHLLKRLESARDMSDEKTKKTELTALYEAASPAVFNDALLDPINSIADLSDGMLKRIKAPDGRKGEAGSAMVGNPAYGQWQTSPSGGSFWVWYGQYRLIKDLLWPGSGPRYNQWQQNRPWSYYNDYGKNRHGSTIRSNKADKNIADSVERRRRSSSYGSDRSKNSIKTNNAFTPTARRNSSYGSRRSTPSRASAGQYQRRNYGGTPERTATRRRSNFGFSGGLRGGSSRSRGGFSFGGK